MGSKRGPCLAGCVIAIVLLGCVFPGTGQGTADAWQTPGWKLVWSDEFNAAAGSFPDKHKWTYDLGNGGFGNPEIEYYCAPGSNLAPCTAEQPNAYQDGNGNLVIRAIRTGDGRWSSARLKTQGLEEPRFGRVEARMKLPVGDGFWPAFWMLGADIETNPWPACGEQDILEWVQSYTSRVTSSTTHGPGYSGAQGPSVKAPFADHGTIADFHVYGVIWTPESLQYYRDQPSQVIATFTKADLPAGTRWVFDKPFFLLLNLAIGSGGFPGKTDRGTPPVATMLVDYVRVYEPVVARK